MLQNIRKNSQGIAAKIIIGLIVGSFALFGVQSILIGSGVTNVAEIDGEGITALDLQQAINVQKRRLLSMFGDQVDPSMLDDNRLQGPALEALIREKLYTNRAASHNLRVSEAELNARIAAMPEFAMDGQFSPELYRNVLAQNGYSPALFKNLLGSESVTRQLRSGVSATEFSTPLELDLTARLTQQKRDIRYLTIPLDSFRAALEPELEEIKAYYDSNVAKFMAPEAVVLEYLEIQLEDFLADVEEEDLLNAYETRKGDMTRAEERRVSHILIEAGSSDDAAAQAQLEELKAQLDQGAEFAQLAQQYSQDIGSAEFGGDLGFTAGDAFPSEMEEALAALSIDEVSAPVKTEAGWHLLKMTELVAGGVPSFDEVRLQILDELRGQNARTELVRQVETLRDLAFNADNLNGPAQELGLTIETSDRLLRTSNTGLFQYPAVVTASFSDEVLADGHNSEVIEVAENHFVSVRIAEHFPSQPRPLADVQAQIIIAMVNERAAKAATYKAEELLVELIGGAGVEKVALTGGYEWQVELGLVRESGALPEIAMKRIFQLPAMDEGSQYDYVTTASGDILLFELDRVTQGSLQDLPEARSRELAQRVGSELGSRLDEQYIRALRDQADIQVM